MSVNLIPLSKIVGDYCIASKDDAQKNFLRNSVFAKRVYQDIYFNILGRPRRQYIQVDPATNSARLPLSYVRLGSIAVIDWKNQVIPLAYNEYINTTPNKENCAAQNRCCDCKGQSSVCDEVQDFTSITEYIQLPNLDTAAIITELKTCMNGDIIKKITQPTWVIPPSYNTCDYNISISVDFSYTIVSYVKNLITTTVGTVIANQGEQDAFFTGLGFTKISDTSYSIYSSQDVWASILTNVPSTITFTQSNCIQVNPSGSFQTVTTTETVCNVPVKPCGCIIPTPQTEQLLVNSCGGWLQSCMNGQYGNIGSVGANPRIPGVRNQEHGVTLAASYPMVFQNATINGTVYTFNTPCINIAAVAVILSELGFGTFRVGENGNTILFPEGLVVNNLMFNGSATGVYITPLNNGCGWGGAWGQGVNTGLNTAWGSGLWANNNQEKGWYQNPTGWGKRRRHNETPTPVMFNRRGTYGIDEDNKIIWIDPKCQITTILLSYYDDGTSPVDGQCYVPDVPAATMAMMDGIRMYDLKYDREVAVVQKKSAEYDYRASKKDLYKFLNPVFIGDLVAALRVMVKF